MARTKLTKAKERRIADQDARTRRNAIDRGLGLPTPHEEKKIIAAGKKIGSPPILQCLDAGDLVEARKLIQEHHRRRKAIVDLNRQALKEVAAARQGLTVDTRDEVPYPEWTEKGAS